MELNKIFFKNYRSLKELELDFNENLLVLIGKNESGKSNILKGISLLNESFSSASEDMREALPDEDEVDDSYVRFVFDLNEDEVNEVFENAKEHIYGFDDKEIIAKRRDGSASYSLKEFCKLNNQGTYRIDIKENSRGARYWTIYSYPYLAENDFLELKDKDDNPIEEDFKIASKSAISGENLEKFKTATMSTIGGLIGGEIIKVINNYLPTLQFWKYDSSNLLPAAVNIQEFIDAPEDILPLKHIFNLAGISEIEDVITKAQDGSKNRFKNLLKRVSTKATAHFNDVWKSYGDIKISLEQNGDEIDCNIEEQNKFSFDQRSDGFKRFISFLLSVSAKDRNNELSNSFLIIDEPDLGLHPSAVRDLRDELISLSSNCFLVVATHSIFMIDPDNLERHRIVNKVSEITEIEIPKSHNLAEEEVMYRAMGYSIYETLNEENIVFEGWRDKKLFQVASSKPKHGMKTAFSKLEKYGICHCNGVRQIKNVTPIFELGKRHCIIVSDVDLSSKKYQKEHKRNHAHGAWYTYKDVDANVKAVTGEDFLQLTYIKDKIKVLKTKNPNLKGNPVYGDSKGFMSAFKEWLNNNGITKNEDVEKMENTIKTILFNDLKPDNISSSYFSFLKELSKIKIAS